MPSYSNVIGKRHLNALIYAIGAGLTVYTLYYAFEFPIARLRYSNIFLGAGLALFYLVQFRDSHFERTSGKSLDSVTGTFLDRVLGTLISLKRRFYSMTYLIFAFSAIVSVSYVEMNYSRLQGDATIYGFTQVDILIGLIIIFLVIHATWTAYGRTLGLVILSSVIYAYTGPFFPGIFKHTGMNISQISREGAIGLSGVYGFIFGVGVTWVAIFIMFAGMAKSYGLMDFIVNISKEIRKKFLSGVVHVAVIGSMAMGSITGSAAANTATTGSFTIPMMKDQGVQDDYAAAIEAVASSGGQMMPPVMGVAAFLMADIIGVPYLDIVQAGLIPAALFYFSVLVATHLVILRYEWTVPETGNFDRSVLKEGAHFIVPFSVLLYTLVILELTPLGAGFYTTLTLIGTMYVRNLIVEGISFDTIVGTTEQTLDGLKQGGEDMAPLVGLLASLGVLIGLVNQTGLSQKISIQMVSLAGGVFALLLVIAMVTSILFGLGMPTPAAYILVVVLVAPSLIGMGVDQIPAHMFVFYFAMLSAITPPVAVSVAIGSQIANADFLTSAKQALRIGAPGFIIPYGFVTNQSLVLWSFPETIRATLLVFIGSIALVVALIGFDFNKVINYPSRGVYLALSLGTILGPVIMQITGAVLTVVILTIANTEIFNRMTYPKISS